MGKNDGPLTPKAIAKKIKAKGLQKLRWYCQMCQKQCRDANGFKCHCESESHQRQILLFAENQGKYMDRFSMEFEAGFMDIVRRQFRSKRVHANLVYNEYIKDRQHVHMNATRWVTLTGFVLYLGRSGKCKVEETPKGWYLTYIERDPEALALQAAAEKKEKMDLNDEEQERKELERRVKAVSQRSEMEGDSTKVNSSVTLSTSQDENQVESQKTHIAFTLKNAKAKAPFVRTNTTSVNSSLDENSQSVRDENGSSLTTTTMKTTTTSEQSLQGELKLDPSKNENGSRTVSMNPTLNLANQDTNPIHKQITREERKEKMPDSSKKRKSSVLEIIEQEERRKERLKRRDYWLMEGILVKVMNKELADGKYFKRKGVVKKVIDKYVGLVKILDSGDLLKVDQEQLETVIPAIGGKVRIVNGAYCGEEGTLRAVEMEKFSAKVEICSGPYTGTVIEAPYEDICKLYPIFQ